MPITLVSHIKVGLSGQPLSSSGHTWHVHVGGVSTLTAPLGSNDCMAAGGHYNPLR